MQPEDIERLIDHLPPKERLEAGLLLSRLRHLSENDELLIALRVLKLFSCAPLVNPAHETGYREIIGELKVQREQAQQQHSKTQSWFLWGAGAMGFFLGLLCNFWKN